MSDDKDKQIFELTKHIGLLTEMMAKDHEIIQDLKTELFLERNRNDRRTNERTQRTTKEMP